MHPSYTFYHEFSNKSRATSHKTVIALRYVGNKRIFVGATTNALSPIGRTSASMDYLKTFCRQVSDSDARAIHPALFAYLDGLNA